MRFLSSARIPRRVGSGLFASALSFQAWTMMTSAADDRRFSVSTALKLVAFALSALLLALPDFDFFLGAMMLGVSSDWSRVGDDGDGKGRRRNQDDRKG